MVSKPRTSLTPALKAAVAKRILSKQAPGAKKAKKEKKTTVKKILKVASRGKKTAIHKAKVGKGSAQLAGRLLNPVKIAKMGKDLAAGKGLVLPGSNYIGPGNPMGRAVKSKGDALAKKHDEHYGRYIDKGKVPSRKVYTKYSDADSQLLKASDTETPEGITTYLGMKAKKLAHDAGLTGKRLRDKDVFPKKVPQGKNPTVKTPPSL